MDRLKGWEHKARMLGIYDDFEIEKEPLYKTKAIQSYSKKYEYTLLEYDGTSSTVVVPPVDRIYEIAFRYNKHIKNIILDKETIIIEPEAFEGCTNLEKIDLSKSKIGIIPSYMCYRCPQLKEIKMNKLIDTIGVRAFVGCKNLQHLDLSNISKLSNNALNSCGLTEVELRQQDLHIGKTPFTGCYNLRKIVIEATNELRIDTIIKSENELPSLEAVYVNQKHYEKVLNAIHESYHSHVKIL